jgi:chromate transporter
MTNSLSPSSLQRDRPALLQLLGSFALISLYGFGGVLAWSRRMMVEERRWMTADEFNKAYALCQFLPGPNIINLSVVFGSRVRGVAGAVMALIGLLAPPLAIVIGLGILYARFGDIPAIGRGLSAVTAAAAGLLIATVVKMAMPIVRTPRDPALVITLVAFIAIGPFGRSLPIVVLVLTPVSLILSWWRHR